MPHPASLEKRLQSWEISYNAYTDHFQIYDRCVFELPNEKLVSKKKAKITMMYEKASYTLLLIDIKDAYDCIGDIEKMKKKDIIQTVRNCIHDKV